MAPNTPRFGASRKRRFNESTDDVVCQALGLDTSDYTFGYVAMWAGGGEQAIAGIKGSCERIQKSAATILRAFEPAAEQEQAA
jgi:hypothetical protein